MELDTNSTTKDVLSQWLFEFRKILLTSFVFVEGTQPPDVCFVEDTQSPDVCFVEDRQPPDVSYVEGTQPPDFCFVEGTEPPDVCFDEGTQPPDIWNRTPFDTPLICKTKLMRHVP